MRAKAMIKGLMVILVLLQVSVFSQTQIIINEFSQGDPGTSHEWIELVVTADNTNIQGVYLDKDDDDDGNGNRWDDIHLQLSTTYAPFSNVAKGAIIVIYRDEGTGRDPTLPPDDNNFTDDNKILIPHTDLTGFFEPGATWPPLKANGDAFGIFNSDGTGIHGVAYGGNGNNAKSTWSTTFPTGTSWGITDLTTVEVGGGQSANFGEGDPSLVSSAANWNAPIIYSSATPKSLNGGNNNALPVELVSFSALIKDNTVLLEWGTATEVNNYGFNVERKTDSEDWKILGFVEGNGNSNSPKQYSFTDLEVNNSGKYYYRLKQIDNDGSYEYSKVIEVNLNTPALIELKQNYPNPFNPSTTISFTLPEKSFVSLKIYNMIGEEVRTLVKEILEAGIYTYNFNAEDLPSGAYVYKLSTGKIVKVRKMLLLK